MLSEPRVAATEEYRHLSFFEISALPRRGPLPGYRSRLSARRPVSPSTTIDPLRNDWFFSWLLNRAGLASESYRREPLRRRLPACLRALRVSSVAEARRRIERQPPLLNVALNSLLLGVTEFFRDSEVFANLQSSVLPALASQRPLGLRVWSAGCSSGAELYSVAMLLDEMGFLEDSQLVGTDCRMDILAQAQHGLFSASSLQGVDPLRRERFFRAEHPHFRVAPGISERIRWRVADVLNGPEPGGGWDLILCRNLAIYLQPEAAGALWAGLLEALRPGGVLVVGKAERLPPHEQAVRLGSCIYSVP